MIGKLYQEKVGGDNLTGNTQWINEREVNLVQSNLISHISVQIVF